MIWLIALPGDPCVHEEQCTGGSNCVDRTCTCPSSMIIYQQQCRPQPISQPGMRCGQGEKCVGDSQCDYDRKICTCPDGFVVEEGKCQPPVDAMTIEIQSASITWPSTGSTQPSTTTNTTMSTPQDSAATRTSPSGRGSVDSQSRAGLLFRTVHHQTTSNTRLPVSFGQTRTAEMRSSGQTHITGEMATTDERTVPSELYATDRTTMDQGYKFYRTTTTISQTEQSPDSMSISRQSSASSRSASTPTVRGQQAHSISSVRVIQMQRCHVDADCSGGAQCARGYCLCPVYQRMKDGQCQSVTEQSTTPKTNTAIPASRRCIANNHCPPGAECVSGICRCPHGTAETRFGLCIPRRTERKKRDTRSVRDNGSEIHTNIASLGEFCDIRLGYRCGNDAICVDGFCQCNENKVQYGSMCIAKENYDQSTNCAFDATICDHGTYCLKDKCVCPPGTKIIDGSCKSPVSDSDAQDESITSSKFHTESAGIPSLFGDLNLAHRVDRFSYPSSTNSRSFEQSATDSFQADMNIAHEPAMPGFSFITGAYAAPLTADSFYTNPYAGLNYGIGNPSGQTNIDYIGATNFDQNPIVGAGSPCVRGDQMLQCTGNSVCANGFCVCPFGEQIINGVCVSRDSQAAPGDSCQIGITFCTGGSLCVMGVCTCPIYQVSLNGQCTPILKGKTQRLPNQPCSSGALCTGNSNCLDGFCKCPTGMFANIGSNACIAMEINAAGPMESSGAPGERCISTLNMANACSGGAICVNGFCLCPNNQVITENKCVPFVGEAPAGGSCVTPGVVCGGGSTCYNGVCECGVGSMPQNGLCVPSDTYQPRPILEPGASCTPLCTACAQCGGGSVCVNNICTCPIGYFPFQSRCVPFQTSPPPTENPYPPIPTIPPVIETTTPSAILVGPGDSCNVSAICNGGSSCIIGRCVCPPGYVPNIERNSCINALLEALHQQISPQLGHSCSAEKICDGGASCVDGVCLCPVNSYPLNGVCVEIEQQQQQQQQQPQLQLQQQPAIIYPGSKCTTTEECQLNSKCFNGYCVCEDQYDTNASGFCAKASSMGIIPGLAGSHCSANSQCASSTMGCTATGHCICLDGYVGDGNGDCLRINLPPQAQFPMAMMAEKREAECSTSSECPDGMECVAGSCSCPTGVQQPGGRCADQSESAKGKNFGMECLKSNDCKTNLICDEHRCSCPRGAYEANHRCVYRQSSVPPGSWCDESTGVMCSGGSNCHQNLCICPQGHHIVALECMPIANDLPIN